MHKLVLVRHGESKWNSENRFTGWTDIGLTKKGQHEAKLCGKLLNVHGFSFDLIYTSLLKRSKDTMEICIDQINQKNSQFISSWRLNERHYGALQGLNKSDTIKEYGEKQVLIWRRSYDVKPPALNKLDKRNPRLDKKYRFLDDSDLPLSESLKDTEERFMPLWHKSIKLKIISNKNILIVAHGNSLRALVKYIDKISNTKILELNIPTGQPLVYELNDDLEPTKHYYLNNISPKNINESFITSAIPS